MTSHESNGFPEKEVEKKLKEEEQSKGVTKMWRGGALKKVFLPGLFMVLSLLIILYILTQARPHSLTPDSVWELVEMKKEELLSVELVYRDCAVPLREGAFQKLCAIFDTAQPVKYSETEIHIPSEYRIRFVDFGDNAKEITIYWFEPDFMKFAEEAPMQLRFDVEIKGEFYSFRQVETFYWTEDISRKAYEEGARYYKLPVRAKVEGLSALGFGAEPMYLSAAMSWQEICEEADLIMTCIYEGLCVCAEGAEIAIFNSFYPLRIFKGSDEASHIFLNVQEGVQFYSKGNMSRGLSPITEPEFEEGKTYFLLLQKLHTETEQDPPLYRFARRAYNAMGIGTHGLYPLYNTEDHPFLNIAIEQVEEYLDTP